MFRAPYTMACISIHPLLKNLFLIRMLTGVDVLTLAVLHLDIVCFLVTTSSPGPPSDNPHYLVPVQRLNIEATLMYCDNVSAIYLFGNTVQHQCTKHIEMDIHFVREKVARGRARVLHVPSRHQIADIFT
ncbi:copia protein, partial [Trifolium medium]|nr:copia protein [Trifolium medium]